MNTENKPDYFFSPSTVSFYPAMMLDDYRGAGTLPDDLVSVKNDMFTEFSGTPPEGKVRGVIESKPAWVDTPPLTVGELIRQANEIKQTLTTEANQKTQLWQTQLMLGIITDEDKISLTEWMRYVQKVQAVDTSTAPDIIWPEKPE